MMLIIGTSAQSVGNRGSDDLGAEVTKLQGGLGIGMAIIIHRVSDSTLNTNTQNGNGWLRKELNGEARNGVSGSSRGTIR